MYIIAGLGNPGKKYENTRHNVGFKVIDRLSRRLDIPVETVKHKGLYGKGMFDGEEIILLKPQTFMNLSGESVRSAMEYYDISPDKIIVICDDINLEPGQLRIRKKGSAGGHNGLKNIISNIRTEDFPRLRVGIGDRTPDSRMDLADYVLSDFSEYDTDKMEAAFDEAADAVLTMIKEGSDSAMNIYNRKKSEAAEDTSKGLTEGQAEETDE